jgi:hypothetical protein
MEPWKGGLLIFFGMSEINFSCGGLKVFCDKIPSFKKKACVNVEKVSG